jgi:uncharacterized membrane protein
MIAALYVAAGIGHLAAPDALLSITPSWVPFAPQVILLTGIFELTAPAALLARSPLRWWAASCWRCMRCGCGPRISSTPSTALRCLHFQ